jgi:acetolactate synthase-1/2/3 large subunit
VADSNGGGIIADVLAAEETSKVFGIPDGTYPGMLNALVARDITVVTPRHETTAIHMAAAYARLTGNLGVAIASNGPGVANALPGIAVENAEMLHAPVTTSWSGRGAMSESSPLVWPITAIQPTNEVRQVADVV